MKFPRISSGTFIFLITLVAVVLKPLPAAAIGESITNGYICEPKNPGGEATRLFFRQQDGVAINLSQSETFPVVCPIVIPYLLPPYQAGAIFKNGSNATQKFNCALEEYDVFSNLVRSIGRSISIPAGDSDVIVYSELVLVSETNYLSLRCIIPPRGMVGLVTWF